MKIVYLHQYFNTPAMSGSTRSYEMARRLVGFGHEVHIVTSDQHPAPERRGWYETEEAGATVHWFPNPYSNHMSYAERIQAFFRFASAASARAASLRGDLVFATSTPLTIALPGVYAAKRGGVPMVFEVRDLWPELPVVMGALKNPLAIEAAQWLERFAYRHSARVVALSPGMAEGVVRTGYPAGRVATIPNSCDLALFDVGAAPGRAFRERFEWLGDRPLVVYCGTLGKINGVSYLARLAAVVAARDPEVRFLVVGGGQEEALVREEAARLGVLDRSFFMLNSVPKAEMPAVLSAATVACSLFLDVEEMWTNSANKFFDALASATPVAINYGGWQAAIIEETGCGLVIDPHDLEAAADRLVAALRAPEVLASLGEAAGRIARERFSRDRLATELEAVMRAAVAERRP